MTTLYLGTSELCLDTGLDVVNVATSKGSELFVELDPRWAEPDTLKRVREDWRLQAPVLVSAACRPPSPNPRCLLSVNLDLHRSAGLPSSTSHRRMP